MAAYAAAISLKNTIQRILQSSRISLPPASRNILKPAYKAMVRLQKALLKLEDTGCSKIRTKVNALDEQIKETVWKFEDLIESHILQQLESSSVVSVDLLSLRQSVDCYVEKVKVMEMAYDIELLYMPEEEGEPISSRIDFSRINSKMVGLSHDFKVVKEFLLLRRRENWCGLVGMAGVGKTTLAKKGFDDPFIRRHFELRAWVKVGRKCGYNEALRGILAQVDPNSRDQMLTQGDGDGNEKVVTLLEKRLKFKKCLVVLDDVNTWQMDSLPRENVRILLTSRLKFDIESPVITVRLLDEEESKKLLGEKVFGEDGFPPHLEKLGEKIAKKCEGLPLVIVTVAMFLSKKDKTLKYWTEVVEKQHNSVFEDAYNQILEVLFPSYDYLPQYLKMFFSLFGSFPSI